MNILVIGSGGREHALTWKLAQSPKVTRLFVAPGNAGTAMIAQNISPATTKEILQWLHEHPIDLVVVGPDRFLADGIVDELHARGILTFGPTKAAAEIEWSKAYAKDFMQEEGIPTAKYAVFSDAAAARLYVQTAQFPVVIKADGLALGKGVIIAHTLDEAEHALAEIMEQRVFGEAGSEVVIEEYLEGKEFSVHAFCDGERAVMFPSSQDHKRAYDNDTGPNTGGMGTIAPVPWVTEDMMADIKKSIIEPLLRGLKKRDRPFSGLVYPGIMMTSEGPKVIEFNARFGDPETESYMRLLKTDLVDVIQACAQGTLLDIDVEWSTQSVCCIMCASGGYPGAYEKGKEISGLETLKDPDVVVFHAGTKLVEGKVVTNGGRVLGVTATAETLPRALEKAYAAVEKIHFDGMEYRKDIGKKSLK